MSESAFGLLIALGAFVSVGAVVILGIVATRHRGLPHPASDYYAGTVFSLMRDKDPDLFASIELLSPGDAMDRWVEKYPDDFPQRGATWVGDMTAIRPKTGAAVE